MYCRRIYIIAEDETQRAQSPGVYESWHVNRSIMLYNNDGDPIVRVASSYDSGGGSIMEPFEVSVEL